MKTTRKALLLIIISSFLAGTGQLFYKLASLSFNDNLLSYVLNWPLYVGVALYGLATVSMILSFREGDLSVLHPFLATSYVWVTLIAPLFFVSESLSLAKITGVFTIFLGVTLIGLGGRNNGN